MMVWGYTVALRSPAPDAPPLQVVLSVLLGTSAGPSHEFVYTQPPEDTDDEDRPKFGKEWSIEYRDGILNDL